jgi:hypothetical protein
MSSDNDDDLFDDEYANDSAEYAKIRAEGLWGPAPPPPSQPMQPQDSP